LVSGNRINAVVPPHPAGAVDIRVSTAAGTSEPEKADQFTYATLPLVAELQPGHGPTRGGALVVVHGGNFVAGQTKVHFGKSLGREVKVVSDRLLVVKSPKAEAGTVPLLVSTPAGDSAEVPFVYEQPASAHQTPEGAGDDYRQQ
jgi:hypothetical protein